MSINILLSLGITLMGDGVCWHRGLRLKMRRKLTNSPLRLVDYSILKLTQMLLSTKNIICIRSACTTAEYEQIASSTLWTEWNTNRIVGAPLVCRPAQYAKQKPWLLERWKCLPRSNCTIARWHYSGCSKSTHRLCNTFTSGQPCRCLLID